MSVLDEELDMLEAIFNDELTVITAGEVCKLRVHSLYHALNVSRALDLTRICWSSTAAACLFGSACCCFQVLRKPYR
jgi:hypothetical protein